MNKIIITSGYTYTDIDTFACAIAYKNLCQLLNINAEVILPGPLNESITKDLKNLSVSFLTHPPAFDGETEFVLVDISEPDHFADFVDKDKIYKIFDHHWGYEEYWKDRLKDNAIIEHVGACATLVWEEVRKNNCEEKISHESRLLLYTAIISNTLNLSAQVTNDRDRQALKEIHHLAELPENWIENYYNQMAESILNNPEKAMRSDSKVLSINSTDFGIIQTELWDSQKFIHTNLETIKKVLKSLNTEHTFLTSPSIFHEHNYIVTEDAWVKNLLASKLQASFNGDIGTTKKLWLRKEIRKALTE